MILTLRTDKPEAEIGLYENESQVAYITWTAHRQLAETLHAKIQSLLQDQGRTLSDISAVACYAGPGSFTGLRIGLTVGNALSYALSVPVVAETSENWREAAIARITAGDNDPLALPEYGADVHITLPKH